MLSLGNGHQTIETRSACIDWLTLRKEAKQQGNQSPPFHRAPDTDLYRELHPSARLRVLKKAQYCTPTGPDQFRANPGLDMSVFIDLVLMFFLFVSFFFSCPFRVRAFRGQDP